MVKATTRFAYGTKLVFASMWSTKVHLWKSKILCICIIVKLNSFHISYCSCFGLLVAIGVGQVYQWNDDIQTNIGLGIKEPTCLVWNFKKGFYPSTCLVWKKDSIPTSYQGHPTLNTRYILPYTKQYSTLRYSTLSLDPK